MSFFLLAWRMFRRGFYRGVSRLNRVVWSGGAERVRLVTSAHFRQFAGVAVAVRSLAAASPAQPWLQAGIGRVRSPSQPFQAMSWVIGERPIRSPPAGESGGLRGRECVRVHLLHAHLPGSRCLLCAVPRRLRSGPAAVAP
ncbi:hypothetical protein Ae717Ps2_5871c [Pseudonocardia sp. Ae717_Ps2]|nr:hypothetical protein Ae717Ps2_5871c [Pseudonocardia sp. Ae717_Ps2]